MFVENFTFSQALPSVRIAGLFCQQITQIFFFANGEHE